MHAPKFLSIFRFSTLDFEDRTGSGYARRSTHILKFFDFSATGEKRGFDDDATMDMTWLFYLRAHFFLFLLSDFARSP